MTTDTIAASRRRLSGWRAAVIWFAVAASVSALVLSSVLGSSTPALIAVVLVCVVASFSVVGAIVVTRLPGNPIGWILWATGGSIAWSITGVSYAKYSIEQLGGSLPWTLPIAVISNVAIVPVLGLAGIFVPLLFPDGHLPSSRWRGVAWLAAAVIALTALVNAVTPGQLSNNVEIQNPIGIRGPEPLQDAIGIAAIASLVLSFVLAVASVVWRYRHGRAVERQQTRWFAYAALVMLVTVTLGLSGVGPLAEAGWVVVVAGLALMPIATGVAIMRYRLYDLDRLVSRTIAYGLITGMLLAAYAGLILLLEGPFGAITNGDTLSVAISTLVVAALFQRIRQRVQRIVDRRFDRARFDAERTTAAFSERLRDEVDIATVTADLDSTVRSALKPTTLALWLRSPSGSEVP